MPGQGFRLFSNEQNYVCFISQYIVGHTIICTDYIVRMYFIAPVCFNTTYCGGKSISNKSLSFLQCCSEFSGLSFASSGQCLLCPKGMYHVFYIHTVCN